MARAGISSRSVDLEAGAAFGSGDTNPILQGAIQGEGNPAKALSWRQWPLEFTNVVGAERACPDSSAGRLPSKVNDPK